MTAVRTTQTSFLIVLLFIFNSACNSSAKNETAEVFSPVGDWKYKVTTDVSYGVITIKETDGEYAASMTTEVFGTLELMNLTIEGTELKADLDVGGTPARIEVKFDKDDMKGVVATSDTEFPFIGERVEDQ